MAYTKTISCGMRSAQRWLVVLTLAYSITGSALAGTSTWTGSVSTDWGTAGNWNPVGVPMLGTDVLVPTSPTGRRFPTVSSGVFDRCTFSFDRPVAGGSFSITDKGTLRIRQANSFPSSYASHVPGATSTLDKATSKKAHG